MGAQLKEREKKQNITTQQMRPNQLFATGMLEHYCALFPAFETMKFPLLTTNHSHQSLSQISLHFESNIQHQIGMCICVNGCVTLKLHILEWE